MSEYVPLSFDEDDGALRVVVFYDPMMGTTTKPLAAEAEFPLRGDATAIGQLCQRMAVMDEHWWPPVCPLMGRLEDGHVVAVAAPPAMTGSGRSWVADVAQRVGLPLDAASAP